MWDRSGTPTCEFLTPHRRGDPLGRPHPNYNDPPGSCDSTANATQPDQSRPGTRPGTNHVRGTRHVPAVWGHPPCPFVGDTHFTGRGQACGTDWGHPHADRLGTPTCEFLTPHRRGDPLGRPHPNYNDPPGSCDSTANATQPDQSRPGTSCRLGTPTLPVGDTHFTGRGQATLKCPNFPQEFSEHTR